MTPLSFNPTVIIRVNEEGYLSVATNVAPDLKVVLVKTDKEFKEASLGQPFVGQVGN